MHLKLQTIYNVLSIGYNYKMKKIHRLALVLIILCCTFLFCGCATVSYSVIETENGGVGQVVDIELDEKQLGSAGATVSQITKMKSDIATIMRDKQTEIMNNYLKKVQNDKSLTSAQRQMLAEGVDTDVKVADSTVSASFVFVNTATYYYFYDIDTSDGDEQVVEKKESLFYSRYIQTTQTIFSNQELINSYTKIANEYIESLHLSNPSKIQTPQYSYSYKTTNTRLKSDADQKTAENGAVTHTWFMSSDQTQREIHFYTVQPRRVVWYSFALGGAIVLVGALFVVNYFKSKKAKRDEVEVIEP